MKIKVVVALLLLFSPVYLWANQKGRIAEFERYSVKNAYNPRVLGLFVGISQYEDPFWHNLEFPTKDVQDMVDFFTDNGTIQLDDKIVLTTPEETTHENILNQKLDAFKKKNTDENDIVIVYFSSHGTVAKKFVTVEMDGAREAVPRKIPYILCSNTREGKIVESAIPLQSILDWFNTLLSKRKVLILDMCFSENKGKSQISPDQAEEIHASKGISYMPVDDSQASIVLASSYIGGISFEDKQLKNSIYTHYLLEGMRKGDLNGDGAVTISEAHNYSIDKTRKHSWERQKYVQIPTAYSKVLGKDPIIVSGSLSRTGDPTLFSYASINQGVEIYIDNIFNGVLPKGVAVQPGNHQIECRSDGQTIYNEEIEFNPQCDYMLPYFDSVFKILDYDYFLMAEGAYRNFYGDDDTDKLLTSGFVSGLSFYYTGTPFDWLAVSCGFDMSQTRDVEQYASRFGLKYYTNFNNTRLLVGPDFMYLNLRYSEKIIEEMGIVDPSGYSFCPGLDAVITYRFQSGITAALGIRGYYLSYQQNSEDQNVLSSQIFFGTGYSF